MPLDLFKCVQKIWPFKCWLLLSCCWALPLLLWNSGAQYMFFIPVGPISAFIFLLLQGERKNWTLRVCIIKVWSSHGADFWSKTEKLEGTCKCLNTKWLRDCFSWTQTSVKWHDRWKQLFQDWLISALKTSDSPSIWNAKTSTSFVNIKQNNSVHTNVWAGFQTAWGKKVLFVATKKKHLFYLCKCKLSRLVVNSVTQGQ